MESWDWKILQVLYEQKSITKTAQTLFTSQPALTARLQQIEKEFGIKIVHRSSKGVQFTPQGEYLANSATQVLQNLQRIREQVANLSDSVSGVLRIGASSYFTMYSLPPLLKQFKQLHPAVEFKVLTAWSREIYNRVHNQEVHLGFVSSDYGWSNCRQLLFEESIYIASADAISLENLPALPRIDYQSDGLIKAMIDGWWRENFSVPPHVTMEVDKLATCKEMVKHGLGYAVMPSRILNDTPQLRRILLTDRTGQPILRKSWLIYQQESLEIKALAAFVDFVETYDFLNTDDSQNHRQQERSDA